ncbi:MAG: cyclic nucleotide-binding domain-containing protein [Gammaproteobacteria bacterium]|nr:cyclic nucleotide-binding domain-containing protein [Gammaproteobacteria bacterium]
MDNPFKYLRTAEWQALLSRAQIKDFGPDEVLLEEGHKPGGIIIIRSGEVKVCRDHSGFQIALAEEGPGTIFGEMSFIESEPANASVITLSKVEILYITHEHVQSIIRENPGFYGRFFQSLAYILSQRLRETTGQVTRNSDDAWATAND